MEDNETAIKVHKSSCAKDCACAAKACCFMCALCGFLTAPAVAAPVRIQPPWLIPDEGLPAKVQVKQTYDISFIKSGTLALACFINPRTKESYCTNSLLDAFKFYEDQDQWPTDDDCDSILISIKKD